MFWDKLDIEICLFGTTGVGKSQLIMGYQGKGPISSYGEDYNWQTGIRIINSKRKIEYRVEFSEPHAEPHRVDIEHLYWWSCGRGNQRISDIPVVLMMYSVSDRNSFEWIADRMRLLNLVYAEQDALVNLQPSFVFVGNKIDCEREVSTSEGVELASKYENAGFYEISAKSGENVQNMIRMVIKKHFKKKNGVFKMPLYLSSEDLFKNEELQKIEKSKPSCTRIYIVYNIFSFSIFSILLISS